ncbi:hypothetical protein LINGRAHAP2_LOCUS6458 [Linum grandiflorum]
MELKKVPCTSNKVQETLKLSYNELSHTEKQIFLDISCIFVREDKERPFYMWANCEFYPESGIKTLILRSLLKIDEVNCFWMLDHIRDFDRTIVAEEDCWTIFTSSSQILPSTELGRSLIFPRVSLDLLFNTECKLNRLKLIWNWFLSILL